ncbi:MAG: hypothetical protein RL133_1054 [Pseudomonadota bacterium]
MNASTLFLQQSQAQRARLESLRGVAAARRIWALVPAAGEGRRAGAGGPKQYRQVNGEVMLVKTLLSLRALFGSPEAVGILVVVSPQDTGWLDLGLDARVQALWGPDAPIVIAPIGGASRADSVRAGLALLCSLPHADQDWVAVHDAARPGLPADAVQRLLSECLASDDGGLLALPVPDTLKRTSDADASPHSHGTVDRSGLWSAQTPQLFPLHRLAHALDQARDVTDEASAMEQSGARPRLVMGDWANRKYTFPEDFQEPLPLNAHATSPSAPLWPRVGTGFDVHALVEGRPLIIGGVHIEHSKGLLGHSDADVLLHAICDAILGAAGLGDIGRHFPDTESQYKGADSRVLLRTVVDRVMAEGFTVYQIDATIIAQAPKMSPHIGQMVLNIQADTRADAVNVKATTTEHLGFTGRGEGIAAQASAVLIPSA